MVWEGYLGFVFFVRILNFAFHFQTNGSTVDEDPYEADTDIDEDVINPETEMKLKKVKQETEVKAVIKPAKNGISKEKSTKSLSKFPPLPTYFDGKIFFVFGSFSTDEVRKSINRHSEPKFKIPFRNC